MKKNTPIKSILPFVFFLFIFQISIAQEAQFSNDKRGIIIYPSDITSYGAMEWLDLLSKDHLNLLGIHTDTRLEPLTDLEKFLKSEEGKEFIKVSKEKNIGIEYELHALKDLLPRSLFNLHPEYFRVDTLGVRNQGYNMCFTSKPAYAEIEKSIVAVTKWLKPTTHRYFFWTDDVQDYCHCDNCKQYTPSDQALLYENELLKMLRKIDPLAQVAHLAYGKTLEKPKKVTPLEGVFLEYAPMYRKFELPLTEKQLKDLKENLTIFPKKTAHILEYWLDESLASWWKRDTLVKLPWNKNYFTRDIKDYRNLGINSITTFAAWLNQEYIDQHGVDHFEQIFREYGEVLYNSESKVIDAKLEDWNGGNPTIGLTDPWDLKDKDHTVFDYKIADGCFYFYFKTKDSTLTVSPFTKELSVAEGDRVELFFSPNKELSNYYCVEIGPKGDVLDYSAAYYRKFNEDWNFKALEVSTLVLDDGYIVEGKIDLDELEALNLIDTIYLGVFRADFHDKEKVNWHTKTIPDVETPDFHTPTAFEKISLKE